MVQESAVAVWDFTIPLDRISTDDLLKKVQRVSKKYCFQIEEGGTGYKHYQGRISLKVRSRKGPVFGVGEHWSVTVSENRFDNFYVCKDETRIGGPWTDEDEEVYIPRQYRNLLDKLHPYQKVIWDSADVFDTRIINMIYCQRGNVGKSTIASLCELFGKGIDLPPVNNSEKLIQTCCDICYGKKQRSPSPVFVDLPRAMDKERLNGIYTAIEQIKKGKLFDLRYKYKEYWIDSPQIWVFSNIEPEMGMLSRDRWRVWVINEMNELENYEC